MSRRRPVIRRLPLALLWLVLVHAGPARAATDLMGVLVHAADPVAVRRDLAGFAASRGTADSVAASSAWAVVASSYQRAGLADSAIACGERAVARHADPEALEALIDGYFARQGAGDVERGRSLLDRRAQLLRFDAGLWDAANTQGRQAWGLYLAGKADSANKQFGRQHRLEDEANPMCWVWRRRMAIVAHAAGDRDRALDLTQQLCVRSLLQDKEANKLLHEILGSDQADQHYAPFIRSGLVKAMQLEAASLEAVHAERVSAAGADGFPLSAVLFQPPPHAKHVVLAIGMPPYDLESCGHIAAGFARAGYAFAVLDPRGSGRSLAASCATPESWSGREATLEHQVAGDVRRMFDAVAKELSADTTGYAVLATLDGSGVAAEAANLDHRVRVLVLVSPAPPRAELGRTAARLKSARVPVFLQTTPSETAGVDCAAQLYDFVDPKVSRIVDSEQAGDDITILAMDTGALPRLTAWLTQSWELRTATRPAPPRKG
jgi:hypothetical protein